MIIVLPLYIHSFISFLQQCCKLGTIVVYPIHRRLIQKEFKNLPKNGSGQPGIHTQVWCQRIDAEANTYTYSQPATDKRKPREHGHLGASGGR